MQLGARLRDLRASAGITGDAAAAKIHSSASKISRMEGGLVPLRPRDIGELLRLYRLSDPAERETLLALAEESSRPGWWDPFSDSLRAPIKHALSIEAAGALIVCYESQAVPALLQTGSYARALCAMGDAPGTWRGGLTPEMLRRRSDLLTMSHRPRVWALVDEAALRRWPGQDSAVMKAQISALQETARNPLLTLQIIPAGAASPLTAPGPFSIVRLPVPDLPDVVLLEQLNTITLVERRREVERYWSVIDTLGIQALSRDASGRLLDEIAGSPPQPGSARRDRSPGNQA
jgi:transcriptional regulator with XRE-family HTH domain